MYSFGREQYKEWKAKIYIYITWALKIQDSDFRPVYVGCRYVHTLDGKIHLWTRKPLGN